MDVHGGRSRLAWSDLPSAVRSRIEELAGARIVEATTALGGFSPGLASTLTLADGRTVFAKAVATDTGPGSSELLRRERSNLERLGERPFASRMLAAHDDGDWVVVLFDHVPGHAPRPSDRAERARMIRAYEEVAASFTPSPIAAATFAEASDRSLDRWNEAAPGDPGVELDPWISANFDLVRTIASRWRDASAGDALVHGDLRADNMLLDGDTVTIVDWTEVCIGAPWVDWTLAVPSVCLFPGTPAPEDAFRESSLAAIAPPADVTSLVAAAAGYFLCSSALPVIPALPTLRDFQREQGLVAALWLQSRVEAGLA
ncbi:phosphotransferase family protein [Microbacterium sulfonylureivorans]|uniref:phosphotransferase family protein n=1 Tax=Microbacterium sulfonylureivorans TaxID=2486854 RepID=UPI000FD6F8F5|nr:phosphotransferase [Microbacterium sulfonylureivorans]